MQTYAEVYRVGIAGGDGFGGVHQPGADAALAEFFQHAEINDLRKPLSAERASLRVGIHVDVARHVAVEVRGQRDSLARVAVAQTHAVLFGARAEPALQHLFPGNRLGVGFAQVANGDRFVLVIDHGRLLRYVFKIIACTRGEVKKCDFACISRGFDVY